jgi:hypothetical protein
MSALDRIMGAGTGNQAAAIDDPERGADWTSLWRASWADTPEARQALLARGRPKGTKYKTDPETGGIAYQDPRTGEWFLEEPSGWQSGLKGLLANAVGGALPAEAGAGIGGVLAGPVGAVGGGMLGEGFRQMLQERLGLEGLDTSSIADVGLAGAGGVAGELGGAGLTALGRGAGRLMEGPAIGGLRARTGLGGLAYDQAAADSLMAKAKAAGIDLTSPELTNDRAGMIAQQWLTDSPQTASGMGRFLEDRRGQIESAIDNYMRSLGGIPEPTIGDQRAAGAVERAREAQVRVRADKAGPLYKQAEQDTVDIAPMVADLDAKIAGYPDSSGMARQLRKASRLFTEATEEGQRVPISSVGKLHAAKTELDDMIESAKRAGNNNLARELMGAKEGLTAALEEGSPTYLRAAQTFREESLPLNAFDASLAGRAVGKAEDPTFSLSSLLFSPRSSPYQVQQAKAAVEAQDPAAWPAMVRAHLQRTLDEVLDPASGDITNVGGMFRKKVFGNERMRAQLKAALTDDQYDRLTGLMDVLQATGQSLKSQSQTEPRQAIRREVERQATPFGSSMLKPREAYIQSQFEQNSAEIMRKLMSAVTEPGNTGFALDRAIRMVRKYGPKEVARRPEKLQALINVLAQLGMSEVGD